jgi:hypothetical protein
MDEMMGQENEAQAGKAGVKLTRAYRLNIEDMTGSSEERLNGVVRWL